MADIFELKLNRLEKLKLKLFLLQTKNRDKMQKALFRYGTIVQVEAQRILYANDHIVSSTLVRSINTQSEVSEKTMRVLIGTHVSYGLKIELLPDGGYLVPAVKNKKKDFLVGAQNAIKQAIKETAAIK